MAKHKKTLTVPEPSTLQKQTDLARGTIKHSALGALVTSKVFCMRVVKAKKGKGSFNRNAKHSKKECYQIAA
ncbi:alternative ribosome-rescue factor A [Psychromonas antarctica]|uniref:alternative ribosome-rescue factor A n=1 Tax=Psychromonas antarctica TaxID=67573 RepID=UPI001EE7F6EC|nr:ribosome alternative rescue factor ArfA [Psychromonas antarctica]MCG6202523.1 ribosome alternative rescue factor ArfA [Psychromonas antarctica]